MQGDRAGVWKDAGDDQKGEQGAEVQRRVIALAAMQEAIMGWETGQECGKGTAAATAAASIRGYEVAAS